MFRKATNGVSITEVLVASSILVLLSVVFVALAGQARTSSEGGAQRIEIRAVHRQAQQRLRLLLRRAMAPNYVDPAIVSPEYGGSGQEVIFHAPSDLIDSSLTFDPRHPDYPRFSLRFAPGSQCLLVNKTDGTGPTQRIGQSLDTAIFRREEKHSIEVTLESEVKVRGASGGVRVLEESSKCLIRLPGIR